MPTIRRQFSSALLAAAVLAATACTPQVNNHGHRLDTVALSQIRPGETSREQVQRLLGSPSVLGTFNDGDWLYISQRTEQMTFYKQDIVEQRVVTISFDDRGLVDAVSQVGLDDALEIEPSKEVTPTSGKKPSVVQQFLGNIGRFNRAPGP
jgi:outer membrane protein assembly factor BamE (lipoprotein component of BamABCDE complex)